LFSLFPLLMLLITILKVVITNIEAPDRRVLFFIYQAIPISRALIQENLGQIMENPGAGGIIGVIALLWAASGVFLTVTRNINLAWPSATMHNIIHSRLIAMSMVIVLSLLLILSVIVNTILGLLRFIQPPIGEDGSIADVIVWDVIRNLPPWIFTFLILFSVYRWIPRTRVRNREAFWGALFAMVSWEITARLFIWYISSGLARFELFYGSLSTILVLLFYIYVSSVILLFGAHLSAAVAHVDRLKRFTLFPDEDKPV
jgi:membrane protein